MLHLEDNQNGLFITSCIITYECNIYIYISDEIL